jgi:hypothetical protein
VKIKRSRSSGMSLVSSGSSTLVGTSPAVARSASFAVSRL